MRDKLLRSILIAVLLAGIATTTAYAQLTAQITGTISDPSGAVIPGVNVTVNNEDTGMKWDSKTNGAGIYTVPLLQPGNYRIAVQAQGFRTVSRSGMRLEVAQTARADFTLELGTAVGTIDVTDTAPLLDTGSNAIGGLVNKDAIENLPVRGRNSNSFMMLVPGVRTTQYTTLQPVLESHYQFFSVNGSRPNQNQFTLDGGNNTDLAFNSPEYSAPVELVAEFRVQTSNYSAEYANAGGVVINIVTKSGTDRFHGSLFDYFRNDALEANDFFSNRSGAKRPMLRYNQFGGTFGGPIVKDRTFFFFSYEGLRFKDPIIRTTSVPTQLQRVGNFSQTFASTGKLVTIYDPVTTQPDPNNPGGYLRTPFPGNIIPKDRIDPVAAALEQYYPAATSAGAPFTGLNNYFSVNSRTRPTNDYSGRVDHQFNSSTIMTARYSESYTTITTPATFANDIGSGGYSRNPQHHPSALLRVNKTFTPTLFAEFVSSWARWWFDRRGLSNGFDPTQLGFPPYLAANSKALGIPSIAPGEMASLGAYNNEHDIADRVEIKANVSKVSGKHTFKFGALYDLGKYISNLHSSADGTYSFSKAFTQGPSPFNGALESGFGYASYLLGTMSSGAHNPGELHSFFTQPYFGFYFQDDYKVTPKLSLNLGIRWDDETPRTERNNQIANFNFTGTATLPNGTIVRGGPMYPGVGGLPRGYWNANHKNFAPRLGFAYSLTNATVLRGGYGMFYANAWGSGRNGNGMPATGFVCSTPVATSLNNGLTPYAVLSNPFPTGFCTPSGSTAGLLTNLGQAMDMIDRNQKVPYAESWDFDIQRRLPTNTVFEIAYSGSRGIHLAGTEEYDQLNPQYMKLGAQLNSSVPNPFYGVITTGTLSLPTITLGQSLRPYPQFLSVTSKNATYGASTYHAMFLRVEHRFSNGFGVLVSYTLSKLIDDVIPSLTGFPGENFSSSPPQNYYNLRGERALASWDTPQTLAISAVYELPFGPGKPLLNWGGAPGKIVGGWQVEGIALFQSGSPLQITGGNDSGTFAGTQRPNSNGRDAALSGPVTDRLGEYFDTSAFSLNAPFTFGNVPRMMPNLRGPGTANVDLSIFKNIRVNDKFRLQLRAQASNSFNRVQFAFPNTTITSSLFGVISAQLNTPRDIQLALRLQF